VSRSLNDLDSRFRPLAFELIARCTEARICVIIVDTLRTVEEQKDNIRRGVSWTQNSKHLPQPPEGKSLAIDIAPYHTYLLNGPDKLEWDRNDPVWKRIGEIGERLGLKWGVVRGGIQIDPGHFEMRL